MIEFDDLQGTEIRDQSKEKALKQQEKERSKMIDNLIQANVDLVDRNKELINQLRVLSYYIDTRDENVLNEVDKIVEKYKKMKGLNDEYVK